MRAMHPSPLAHISPFIWAATTKYYWQMTLDGRCVFFTVLETWKSKEKVCGVSGVC
jgi:hypothetical protein